MKLSAEGRWGSARGTSPWHAACAALLVMGLVSVAGASEAPADESAQGALPAAGMKLVEARAAAHGARCGSVVIRHCPQPETDKAAPDEWQMVQFAGPDSDEIVVNGQRIRNPGVREVFERTFGSPLGSAGMRTRVGAAGARCTTVAASGATLCSNGGNSLPALDNPLTDWTF